MSAARCVLVRGGVCALAALLTAACAFAVGEVLVPGEWLRAQMQFALRRGLLDVHEAPGVLLTNARVAAAPIAAALLVQRRPAFRTALDLYLAALLALNAGAVGVAVAAYGTRLLPILVPHGALELVAFSLAGGGYLTARTRPLPAVTWAVVAAATCVLLVVAAVVEAGIARPGG